MGEPGEAIEIAARHLLDGQKGQSDFSDERIGKVLWDIYEAMPTPRLPSTLIDRAWCVRQVKIRMEEIRKECG